MLRKYVMLGRETQGDAPPALRGQLWGTPCYQEDLGLGEESASQETSTAHLSCCASVGGCSHWGVRVGRNDPGGRDKSAGTALHPASGKRRSQVAVDGEVWTPKDHQAAGTGPPEQVGRKRGSSSSK